MRRTTLAIFLLTLSFSSKAQAEDAWIYIFWGQSNMRSSGVVGESAPIGYQTADIRRLVWHSYYRQIQYYFPGYNSDIAESRDVTPQVWGPEASFANAHLTEFPSQTIYILKYALSGTRMASGGATDNWNPAENELFNRVTVNLRRLRQRLIAQGLTPKTKAVMGMQGEGDSHNSLFADQYHLLKLEFYAQARISWGDNDTIFVDGRLSDSLPVEDYEAAATTRAGMMCAAAQEPQGKARMINLDDLEKRVDEVHYTTNSILTVGERMYEAYMGRSQLTLPNPGTCP